jgi:hypothetical protein
LEGWTVRIVVQQLVDGIELCARLGLLLVSKPTRAEVHTYTAAAALDRFGIPLLPHPTLAEALDGQIVHAVLPGSPCDRAGISAGDIVVTINGVRLDSIRHLVFSDCRSCKLNLLVYVARRIALDDIKLRVCPEPYRPIAEIVAEAMLALPASPASQHPIDRFALMVFLSSL